ncbi:putative maleylacetoacetate isomerase 2 [Atta colombica]|uniref:Putative maleylacetoacetate isomerase 2 n=1 Tax=Atta colombica TaxID=520822 RepID=A0A195BG10_9HYME|nr:putative maleylacetoacetate isomerase 2 [Atta colombica]
MRYERAGKISGRNSEIRWHNIRVIDQIIESGKKWLKVNAVRERPMMSTMGKFHKSPNELFLACLSKVVELNILQYLEETRPNRSLMPVDPIKRARVREICEIIASGIQPLQNIGLLTHVGEERKTEWAQNWITRGFTAVEKLLLSSAGKYCVGDEITLADCCLVPQIYNARKFHVDLKPFSTILRVDRHLEHHPAFTTTHPNNQPDCPPEATK